MLYKINNFEVKFFKTYKCFEDAPNRGEIWIEKTEQYKQEQRQTIPGYILV